MSLEDLKRKYGEEAKHVGTGFWNPKVGDSVIGKVTEVKTIGEQDRWVFHNIPGDQFIILPNHGHLNKQLGDSPIGKYFYIQLSSESLMKSGLGKGKVGKLYYVAELSPDEIQEVEANLGTEEPIDTNLSDGNTTESASEDDVDFNFK